MYIAIKETIKKYFQVKMKEACGDALSSEPILNFKKVLKKSWLLQMATCGRCYPQFDDCDAEYHPN